MKIIYRIYEKLDMREQNEWGYFDDKKIISQEVCLANSREEFKKIITELYSPEPIYFANSKKRKVGDLICIIISDNAYDAERYLLVKDYECENCKRKFKATQKTVANFSEWDLRNFKDICEEKYLTMENEIIGMSFCCRYCYHAIKDKINKELKEYAYDNDLTCNSWITKDSFSSISDGFIYMISKKSTGEFYVGQTRYVPIFRWGQHLLTKRFKIENIEDYVFEVLEVCDKEELNYKEAYWINKKRDENSHLSLNKFIPKYKEEIE